MWPSTNIGISLVAMILAQALYAQAPSANPPIKTPVTSADLRIVQRAAEILDAPGKWNRADPADCPSGATTFSVYCAMAKATEEVSGKVDDHNAAMQEARVTIDVIASRKYGSRFTDFNDDPATTFADLQAFFRILKNRLTRRMTEEAPVAAQSAQLEESNGRPPVNEIDLRIVRRASEILSSPKVWNRNDTRVCPAEAKTFSLYCALERATKELSGKFEHRGAAMQEARFVIEDIAPNVAYYDHRLMNYNNDPSTTFFDVQKFFHVLEERLAQRVKEEHLPKAAVR